MTIEMLPGAEVTPIVASVLDTATVVPRPDAEALTAWLTTHGYSADVTALAMADPVLLDCLCECLSAVTEHRTLHPGHVCRSTDDLTWWCEDCLWAFEAPGAFWAQTA